MGFWHLSIHGNSNVADLKAKVREFADKLRADGHPVEVAALHHGEVERLDPQPPLNSQELPAPPPEREQSELAAAPVVIPSTEPAGSGVDAAPPAQPPLPTEAQP